MRRLVLIGVCVFTLAGCSATPQTGDEQFTVKRVENVATCIVYKPGGGTVQGTQMECDFR